MKNVFKLNSQKNTMVLRRVENTFELKQVGRRGMPGISAYQVAVEQGFVGTEQEWLDSLKGGSMDDNTIIGDGTDKTVEINALLLANAGKAVRLIGDFTISSPIRVPSDTTLDATGATITMPQGVKTNMVQNYALAEAIKILDGVTTASSSTVTAASALFTPGVIGRTIRIYQPGGAYHETTIDSRTSATTIVLSSAVPFSGTGLYIHIGSRDKNVRLFGGSWFRSLDNFDGSTHNSNSNSLNFRHVDGLEIGNVTIETLSGKYAINPADCEHVNIHDIITSRTNSDFLHFIGPLNDVVIRNVSTAGSGDDIVAFTGGDWRVSMSMSDVYGSIRNVLVDGVYTDVSIEGFPPFDRHDGTNGSRGILLVGGRSVTNDEFTIDNVTVTNFRGRLGNSPVHIIADTSDTGTTGGIIKRVTFRDGVNISGTDDNSGHFVLVGIDVEQLIIDNIKNVGAASDIYVADGTVDTLWSNNTNTDMVAIGTTGHVSNMKIVKPNAIAASEENTFTKVQHFQDSNDVGVKTDHIRVYPRSPGGSASVFLDNENGGTWEFFANHGGSFGVYDQATGRQPFTVEPGAPSDALKIEDDVTIMKNPLQVEGNIRTQRDNTYVGADDGSIPRLGLVKQGGGGPFMAVGKDESFKFKFNTTNNDIDPASSYDQVAEIFRDGQISAKNGESGNRLVTRDYVDAELTAIKNFLGIT